MLYFAIKLKKWGNVGRTLKIAEGKMPVKTEAWLNFEKETLGYRGQSLFEVKQHKYLQRIQIVLILGWKIFVASLGEKLTEKIKLIN